MSRNSVIYNFLLYFLKFYFDINLLAVLSLFNKLPFLDLKMRTLELFSVYLISYHF